jgi:hypothetical protein
VETPACSGIVPAEGLLGREMVAKPESKGRGRREAGAVSECQRLAPILPGGRGCGTEESEYPATHSLLWPASAALCQPP